MGENEKEFLYDGKNTFRQNYSLEHLISSVSSWTLAADAKLLGYLHNFSQQVQQKTQKIVDSLNDVEYKMKLTASKLNNSTNDFNTLANSQFIENKVYEDTTEVTETKKEEVNEVMVNEGLSEEKLVAKISQAAILAYEKLNNKTDCHPLFSTENLPYLIASNDFKHNFGRESKYKKNSVQKTKPTQETSTSLESSMESGKTDTSRALTNVDDDVISGKNDLEGEDEEEDYFFNAISNKKLTDASSLVSLTSEQRESKFKSIFDEDDEDDMFNQDFLKPPPKQTPRVNPSQNANEVKEEAKEKPQVEKTSDKADFMSQLSQKLKQKSFREHSRSPVKQEKEEEEDNEEQLAPEVATKEKKKPTVYKSIFDDDDDDDEDDDDFLKFTDKKKALTPPTVDATVKNTAKKTDKPSLLVTNRDVKNFFDDDDDEDDDEVEKNALKNDELVKTSEPTTQPTATQPSNKNFLSSKLKSIFDDDDDDDDMFSIIKKDTTVTKSTEEPVEDVTIAIANSKKATTDTSNQLATNITAIDKSANNTTTKSNITSTMNSTANTKNKVQPTTKQTTKPEFKADDDDDDFGIFKHSSDDEDSKVLPQNIKTSDIKIKEDKPATTTPKPFLSASDDDDDEEFFSIHEKSTKSAVSAVTSSKESKHKITSIFDSSGDEDDEDIFNITPKIPASKTTTNIKATSPASNTTPSQPSKPAPLTTDASNSRTNAETSQKSETNPNNVTNNPPERAKTVTKPNNIKAMAFSNVIKEMKDKRKNLFDENEEELKGNIIREEEPPKQPPLLQRIVQPKKAKPPSQLAQSKPSSSQPTHPKPQPPLPSQRHKPSPKAEPPKPQPPLTLSPPPSPTFHSAQENTTNFQPKDLDLDDFLSTDHKPTTLNHNIVKTRPRINHRRPIMKPNMHTESIPDSTNIINNNTTDVSIVFNNNQSATTQSNMEAPPADDITAASVIKEADAFINKEADASAIEKADVDGRLSLDNLVHGDAVDVGKSDMNLQKDAADGLLSDVPEVPKIDLTRDKDLFDLLNSDNEVKINTSISDISLNKNEKPRNIFDSDSSDDNIAENKTSTINQNKTIEQTTNKDVIEPIAPVTNIGLYENLNPSSLPEGPPPLNDDGADSDDDKDIFQAFDSPPSSRDKSVERDQWQRVINEIDLPTGYSDIKFNNEPIDYNDKSTGSNNADKPTEASEEEDNDDDFIFAKTSGNIDIKNETNASDPSANEINKENISKELNKDTGDDDKLFKADSAIGVISKKQEALEVIKNDDSPCGSKTADRIMDFGEDDDDEDDEDIFKVLAAPKASSVSKKTIIDIFDGDFQDDITTNSGNNDKRRDGINKDKNNKKITINATNNKTNITTINSNNLEKTTKKEKSVRNIFDSEDDSDDDDFIFSKATNNYSDKKDMDKEGMFFSPTLTAQSHKDLKDTKTKSIVYDPLNVFK